MLWVRNLVLGAGCCRSPHGAEPSASPVHVTARWTAWDHANLDEARITMSDDGWQAKGEIAAEPGERPWCKYAVACDDKMRARQVKVDLGDGRSVRLESDGEGNWTKDGAPAPILNDAIDVDLSGTPLTNTLPIVRLGLRIGSVARITCAYVDLASIAVRAEVQQYARLGERRYHFQAPAHGFARDIEVDANALVVSYPGLFRRVA